MKKEQQECYVWIQNIIDSCNNTFHFDGAKNLIVLYSEKFKDPNTTAELMLQYGRHFNNIHNILN